MASTINASASSGLITTADTSTILQLQTAGTTALTVDASQNVGIGTASPAGYRTRIYGGNDNTLAIDNDGSRYTTTNIANNGTTKSSIYWDNTNVNLSLFATAASSQLLLGTAGTERMRIDSSGNVGIGTSSPATKLHVQKNGKAFQLYDGSTNDGVYAVFAGSSLTKNWCIGNQFNVNGSLEFTQTTANGGTTIGSTPAMVINSSGNLLVGTTSGIGSNGKLQVVQTTTSDAALSADATNASYAYNVAYLNTTRAASTAYSYIRCTSSNYGANQFIVGGTGVIFSAALSGGATTLSVNASAEIIRTPSDASLKTNVQPITYGLDAVMKLKPIKHEWVESIDMGAPSIGFIAQDMELEIPEIVSGEEYKSIDYPKLTAVLTKAIQEQQALITQLQADVAALKGAQP